MDKDEEAEKTKKQNLMRQIQEELENIRVLEERRKAQVQKERDEERRRRQQRHEEDVKRQNENTRKKMLQEIENQRLAEEQRILQEARKLHLEREKTRKMALEKRLEAEEAAKCKAKEEERKQILEFEEEERRIQLEQQVQARKDEERKIKEKILERKRVEQEEEVRRIQETRDAILRDQEEIKKKQLQSKMKKFENTINTSEKKPVYPNIRKSSPRNSICSKFEALAKAAELEEQQRNEWIKRRKPLKKMPFVFKKSPTNKGSSAKSIIKAISNELSAMSRRSSLIKSLNSSKGSGINGNGIQNRSEYPSDPSDSDAKVEMQNYLISHVLFDGNEDVSTREKQFESYKRDMEEYLSLFEDVVTRTFETKTKKNTTMTDVKHSDFAFRIKGLKNRFENERIQSDSIDSKNQKRVGKLSGVIDKWLTRCPNNENKEYIPVIIDKDAFERTIGKFEAQKHENQKENSAKKRESRDEKQQFRQREAKMKKTQLFKLARERIDKKSEQPRQNKAECLNDCIPTNAIEQCAKIEDEVTKETEGVVVDCEREKQGIKDQMKFEENVRALLELTEDPTTTSRKMTTKKKNAAIVVKSVSDMKSKFEDVPVEGDNRVPRRRNMTLPIKSDKVNRAKAQLSAKETNFCKRTEVSIVSQTCSKIKNIFEKSESEKSRVTSKNDDVSKRRKSIIQVPEVVEFSSPLPKRKWKYQEKSLEELGNFVRQNKTEMPPGLLNKANSVLKRDKCSSFPVEEEALKQRKMMISEQEREFQDFMNELQLYSDKRSEYINKDSIPLPDKVYSEDRKVSKLNRSSSEAVLNSANVVRGSPIVDDKNVKWQHKVTQYFKDRKPIQGEWDRIQDPEERKKAILAKHGIKEREPSTTTPKKIETEDWIPDHVLKDEILYKRYLKEQLGIGRISNPSSIAEKPSTTTNKRDRNSIVSLLNLLEALKRSLSMQRSDLHPGRKAQSVFDLYSSSSSSSSSSTTTSDKTCSQIRQRFENPGEMSINKNNGTSSTKLRKPPKIKSRDTWITEMKSAQSMHNLSGKGPSSSNIRSELNALRASSSTLRRFESESHLSQKPDRIRTRRSSDLDDEVLAELSTSNSMIKAMFEASAPKYKFGGKLSISETKMKPKARKTKGESRQWVLDTVNKYFDVIVEEEESKNYSDSEEDDDDEGEEDNDLEDRRRYKSTAKMREMVSSVMSRHANVSHSDLMTNLKRNLSSHIKKKSRENLYF